MKTLKLTALALFLLASSSSLIAQTPLPAPFGLRVLLFHCIVGLSDTVHPVIPVQLF